MVLGRLVVGNGGLMMLFYHDKRFVVVRNIYMKRLVG